MGTLASTVSVFLAVCGISPQEDVSRDRVDLVEVNHFYDDTGRHVFDQVIFYDWSSYDCRHVVRAWRMVKTPSQLPKKSWSDNTYTAIWIDGEVLREVRASSMRESWTQYDPELLEREFLPKEKRRELRTAGLPKATDDQPRAIRPRQLPPSQPSPDRSSDPGAGGQAARERGARELVPVARNP